MEIPRHSQLTAKQEALFKTIEKVCNGILRRKGLLPTNMNIELDFYQWASNRLFNHASQTTTERITFIIQRHDPFVRYKGIAVECVSILNMLHRGLGIKGGEITEVQLRRKVIIDVEFIP
jgi:hypothetical protein